MEISIKWKALNISKGAAIMSIGYCAYADLVQADETLVMYTYCCFNNNNEDYKRYVNSKDGEIYIDRAAFAGPEIQTKKKKSSGKSITVIKRSPRDVQFDELIRSGGIKVKNASGTWRTTDFGIDVMALRILFKLFDEYQKTGTVPEHIGYNA